MPTYLFGTLGDRTLDLTELCGGKPTGSVTVYPTTATVGLGILTLGTYTPLEVRVECSAPANPPPRRATR
ncbi:MAG TPA: hypothetical protein VFV94_15715 [Polyangiaceae bacterium]|nr:hypothetical protein [Polyangiaceae bacterium]